MHDDAGQAARVVARRAQRRVLLRELWRGTGASVALWSLKIFANGGLIGALAGLPLEAALRAGLGGELGGGMDVGARMDHREEEEGPPKSSSWVVRTIS